MTVILRPEQGNKARKTQSSHQGCRHGVIAQIRRQGRLKGFEIKPHHDHALWLPWLARMQLGRWPGVAVAPHSGMGRRWPQARLRAARNARHARPCGLRLCLALRLHPSGRHGAMGHIHAHHVPAAAHVVRPVPARGQWHGAVIFQRHKGAVYLKNLSVAPLAQTPCGLFRHLHRRGHDDGQRLFALLRLHGGPAIAPCSRPG